MESQSRVNDVRPWTLLVYMVSDDVDVSPEGSVDVRQTVNLDEILVEERRAIIEAAVRRRDMHVAIQIDLLRPMGTFRSVNGISLDPRPESVSTDPGVLDAFFQWAIDACPAQRYAVLFWGHSSGPSGLFTDEIPAFGFSRTLARTLDLAALGRCLEHAGVMIREQAETRGEDAAGKKIELVLFKDCFQSILETAFELGRAGDFDARAEFMIASQGLIPVATQPDEQQRPKRIPAWPYYEMFACLGLDDTRQTAHRLVEVLEEFYKIRGHKADHLEVPFTALNLRAVGDVVVPLKALQERLTTALDHPEESDRVYDAFRRAFRGIVDGDPVLVDMQSLCERLGETGIENMEALADLVIEKIDVVVDKHTPGDSKFQGLSVYYYPESPEDRQGSAIGQVLGPVYKRLRLNALTGWHNVALSDTPSTIARRRALQ